MLKNYTEKTSVAKTIIALIVVAILEFIAFYILLPPLNIHDIGSWFSWDLCTIVFDCNIFFAVRKIILSS